MIKISWFKCARKRRTDEKNGISRNRFLSNKKQMSRRNLTKKNTSRSSASLTVDWICRFLEVVPRRNRRNSQERGRCVCDEGSLLDTELSLISISTFNCIMHSKSGRRYLFFFLIICRTNCSIVVNWRSCHRRIPFFRSSSIGRRRRKKVTNDIRLEIKEKCLALSRRQARTINFSDGHASYVVWRLSE